ncbi:MAG: hypothetical protein Q4D33_02010, partial [Prevotellaceae bacterium]|nr:hypothetical protein [Prevotellaceae bacterium]
MNNLFQKLYAMVAALFCATTISAAILPTGLEVQEYILTAQDFDNGKVTYDAKIAFDGNTAYLGNFAFNAKDCWIQGTKNGNTITFPEEQLMTTTEDGTEIWFYGVTVGTDGVSSNDFVLTYDASANEYLASSGLMLTMGKPTASSLNYLEILEDVLLSKTGRVIEPEVNINTNIITTQPAGELKVYTRSGGAYNNFYNSPSFTLQDGMALNMVYAADNVVYMQAPISYAGTTNWVKGYIEGNKIHMPLYQSIVKSNNNNYGIIGVCRWNRTHTFLEPYLRATEMTFTIDEDGVIRQDGDDAYCLLWSIDMSWSNYADLNSVYTPNTELVSRIPDGLVKEEMAMHYKVNPENKPLQDANIVLTSAIDAENGKFYLAGLLTSDPDAAIVGSIEGNTIVFPSSQYLGVAGNTILYFSAANYHLEPMDFGGVTYNLTRPEYLNCLTMTRDDNGVWNVPDNVGIFLTQGMPNEQSLKYYMLAYLNPAISTYNEHPAVPRDPEIVRYTTDMAGGGYDCINLRIIPEDVDGQFINPQRLAYQLFVQVDGQTEPYIFYKDEYQIAQDMEVIPFIFSCRDQSNATDIAVGGTEVYLYQTGFDNIGVQVINYSGGEEHRSNLVWWKDPTDNPDNPDTPDNPDNPDNPGDDDPNAQSITWGYYNGTQDLGTWGTDKSETYYVAMKVNDPSLVGSKVTKVRIPVASTDVTDCHLWFTRGSLASASGQGTNDAVNVEFTPTDTWTEVELPEPFVITEGDFFVGITFTASATAFQPLLLMPSDLLETTYIKTSRTYRKWTDLGKAPGACLPLQLTVRGNVVKENAVSIVALDNVYVKHDNEGSTKVIVANNGGNVVTDIDWSYTVNGTTSEGHADVAIAADYYGQQGSFTLTTPAIADNGEYEGTLTIVNVNGKANTSNSVSATHMVKVMNVVPKKRVLMEEYTGAWCGFCPSGYIGMKLMNERHPGEFICASYHNGDAMQITTNYPSPVDGFPTAYLDRDHFTDAYLGDTRKDMGIEETWAEQCKELSPLNVDVVADLNSTTGEITANATFEACDDMTGTNYGVAYIITADGLTGSGTQWRQHNYYSYAYQGGAYSGMYNEGMDMFNNGAEYQFLVYDDVAIATSCPGSETISGVIN